MHYLFQKRFAALIACMTLFAGALLVSGTHTAALSAEPSPDMMTIESQEVKDEASGDAEQGISLADVESARHVTGARVYGLAALWLLIALCIFLLRYQVRDDERLYEEGYYDKSLE